ncbi:putative aldouronate transport system substrate-binding protein [Kribbella sp. VKM Ac-2527]|uniref:Putative aldouronate transport system substrate-binding protein n=1 Tax=Kribbella caucasensis TaxID=2512215 RepID=A0A4R6KH32_9ACTN|nr:extracellular solute-binding protein [Kribbella sp. VKM Ac-2527]TDO50143.1 putative aldouronate transport system substrate-binding protein [Kribbella sp. VKM Ac-2527]
MSTHEPGPAGVARRSVLLGGIAGLGAAAFGGTLLSGCSAKSPTSTAASRGLKNALPAYLPIASDARPIRPGSDDGLVMAVYDAYPKDPFSRLPGPVGDGKPTTAFMVTYSALPPPKEQNAYWQSINKQLNTDLSLNIVAGSDYPTKIAALIAGGTLPDIVQVQTNTAGLQRLADIANAKFVDMGPYLSGDKVKDYPYLANIPTQTWKASVWGGRLFGVPTTRSLFGTVNYKNVAVLEAAGVTEDATDLDGFTALCQQVTNPSKGIYALSGETGVGFPVSFSMFLTTFGVANGWAEDAAGALTLPALSDEWYAAIEYTKKLWKLGVYDPNTPAMTNAAKASAFEGGRLAFIDDALAYWNTALKRTPGLRLDMRTPFGADGAKPVHWLGLGTYGTSAIRKENEDRVPALLSMLNYLAAPFGTKEFLHKEYGEQGVTYKVDAKGNPVRTERGDLETTVNINRLANGPLVLFDTAVATENLIRQQEAQKKLAAIALPNPSAGYDTAAVPAQGSAAAMQNIYDTQTGYILGRKSLADLKTAVSGYWDKYGKSVAEQIQQAKAADK